ncbi:hypothetical protein M0R04_15315 [Candidatus Dojkabacteria bacterium]|jgi:hypothetical protein|nr:hypothetical protein [Candidatus Dojkabacteria bacterium]
MEILDQITTLEKLCKLSGKWGLFILFGFPDHTEEVMDIFKASFLTEEEKYGQVISDGCGYFLFGTEKEMEKHYYMCAGDDGPTELNKYNGNLRVYALTCDPNGQTMNENT